MEKRVITSEQYAGLVIQTTKVIVAEEKARDEYKGLGPAYYQAKEIVAELYVKQATTVCTVCGNDTPLTTAENVSDDPDAVVYVGAECILGWFAWQELQGVRSYVETEAALFAREDLKCK